ncbi:olfactory receptor 1E5-like [Trichomycterus rosablanca]|uniref:olfactory receptor 1E5-like n=1 Tax=Trichomycterus rosablanca TaxID=2290929 RepID=UPI002F35E8F8
MMNNTQSSLTLEFFIVGFPGLLPDYYNLMAAMFFIIYLTTILGNLLLVVSFLCAPNLQKPMYITMLSLALSDIGFSTVALPKIISRYWFNNGSIPFFVCLFQRLLIHYFGTLNSLIMMTMAIDRYLAICFPFRYPVLMTNQIMSIITGLSWASAVIAPGITTIQTANLPFCGPNRIIHCYCDSMSMNALACADITFVSYVSSSLAAVVLLLPFGFIIFSYACIIVAVIRTANNQAKLKAFSTCSTQLCIISIYYVPRVCVYVTPYIPSLKWNVDQRLVVTMFYGFFPPLVNPLIYFFRTKEIRQLLIKWCTEKKCMTQVINIVSVSK